MYVYIYIYIYIYTHTHTHIQTYIHAYVCLYTPTHTHTHKHICPANNSNTADRVSHVHAGALCCRIQWPKLFSVCLVRKFL